ncbi:hypothetical protein F441_21111 [Phytophthora nicotianae CJ01A1]|uniref:ABC transporter domain-containing protein n=1 Tax=Phytophthora nicotianae CJ01A1 TaxID=1317063 RepID=W2VWH5_PHYNI|nr:hypothetical protein F441_21111 [Phytophthora nicotianae CJ01A1]
MFSFVHATFLEARFSSPSIYADVVATEEDENKEILRYVSGVVKPGSIALVLDQPGFSKTSLMKVLSGRFVLEKVLTVAGDVVWGRPTGQHHACLPQLVAYVEQRYKLSPTLMVKEILEYEQRVQVCDHRRDGNRHERGVTNKMQKTVVVALLHLAPKVVEVFDEVTILNEGEMMCHGPRNSNKRNTAFRKGRGPMVIVRGLINASMFWNVDPVNVLVPLGVLFQAVLFLSLDQISQIPTFMAVRDISY